MTETMQQAEGQRSHGVAASGGRRTRRSGASFAEREQCLLGVANEAIRGVQAKELQEIADRFNECEEVVDEGALQEAPGWERPSSEAALAEARIAHGQTASGSHPA